MNYLDFILTPLMSLDATPSNPIFTIFLIAAIISFIIVVFQKILIDYDKMHELQDEMKQLQDEMRAAQSSGDPKALAKVQKKQMELLPKNTELMKMQMKPTILTMIPILIIYYGMIFNHTISHVVINIAAPQYYLLLIPIWNIFWTQANPLTINFFGWYLLVSFTMSFIFRRLFGLNTTN
ncbi:MAG: EMC3/TMCO1 family protein [Methanosphaera sp.]|uniref:EMC3/TMCO1 family protein n=1 Tax=Methanosphaera sp. TaxID=2666342 RepID=UPI0025F0615A|nr:EMC3/TMCO1 family protein [Methanosphaera sp.]MCI5866658.1 EMC3/TMCO1 family protein [Methanosphaera sp.]MDD6535142.1 EMC3/TMCO1 family protein [Methanosphaera sp.]MDY3955952.1 EMC3/TMCO1 family protein [Methanosphaera sp.]